MHPGPEPEFLQRTGKAQKTIKSTYNTGSWKRLIALIAHNTQDGIGQTQEQELVAKLPDEFTDELRKSSKTNSGKVHRQTSDQAP